MAARRQLGRVRRLVVKVGTSLIAEPGTGPDPDPNTGRDLLEDLDAINAELAAYSAELAARPQIVVVNKADLLEGDAAAPMRAATERVRARCVEAGQPFMVISAVTGHGLRELVSALATRLDATGWLRAAS